MDICKTKVSWDDEKCKLNIKNHHISFETAALVFADIHRIDFFDALHSTLEEERRITIGKVKKILFVVYTERNNGVRIISARRATKAERKLYE